MSINDPIFEADELIEELINTNRFFTKSRLILRLERYIKNIDNPGNPLSIMKIKKDSSIYRARLCDKQFAEKKTNESQVSSSNEFRGYNKKNSFLPPVGLDTPDGRTNPKYIRYLYASVDQATALAEVKPTLGSYVSVATLLVKKSLTLLNITIKKNSDLVGWIVTEEEMFQIVMNRIFSSPCSGELRDYLPGQYISEYIKSWNSGEFDGICFNSSLDSNGKNLTIFNYKKCEPISSKIFQIDSIKYHAHCFSPSGDSSELGSK